MINKAMKFVRDHVNEYLRLYLDLADTDMPVVLSNLVDNNATDTDEIPQDQVLLSLIHIEEERTFKSQDPNIKRKNAAWKGNPDFKLNLYVLFAANFTYSNYEEGLKSLSGIIACFQRKNVFEPSSFPGLDPSIHRIVVDLFTPSMEQASQMWQAMGGKFLANTMFKIRLLVIRDEQAQYPVALIEQIDAQ